MSCLVDKIFIPNLCGTNQILVGQHNIIHLLPNFFDVQNLTKLLSGIDTQKTFDTLLTAAENKVLLDIDTLLKTKYYPTQTGNNNIFPTVGVSQYQNFAPNQSTGIEFKLKQGNENTTLRRFKITQLYLNLRTPQTNVVVRIKKRNGSTIILTLPTANAGQNDLLFPNGIKELIVDDIVFQILVDTTLFDVDNKVFVCPCNGNYDFSAASFNGVRASSSPLYNYGLEVKIQTFCHFESLVCNAAIQSQAIQALANYYGYLLADNAITSNVLTTYSILKGDALKERRDMFLKVYENTIKAIGQIISTSNIKSDCVACKGLAVKSFV